MYEEDQKMCPCGCGLTYEQGILENMSIYGESRSQAVYRISRFEKRLR